MKDTQTLRSGRLYISALGAMLLMSSVAQAADDWEFAAEVYGWLPNIDIKEEGGQSSEITLDDILDNLDFTAMIAVQARKGKWSFSNDLVYLDLTNKPNDQISPRLTLKKLELQAWIVSPTVGYAVFKNESSSIDLYAGARYLDLEVNTTLELRLPGNLPERRDGTDTSDSNWDAIVGVRGNHRLSDKWHLPFSIDAGTGQSDSTFQANAALAYQFESLDAVIGWRYLTWDIGGEIDELTVNGPYVGVIARF